MLSTRVGDSSEMARKARGWLTRWNGTLGMLVDDSSEWNAWYAGGDQGTLGCPPTAPK